MTGKSIKLDKINRKIITTLHTNAGLSNVDLADRVGLSKSACFERVKALKEAGYFGMFVTELDIDRICEHIFAYIEFTLENNTFKNREIFEKKINGIPELMDCFYVTGNYHYISYACCSNVQELNKLCDNLTADESLGIAGIAQRVVLNRAKWHLGYPLDKLRWLD